MAQQFKLLLVLWLVVACSAPAPGETTTPLVETTTPLVETTTPLVETTTPIVETTTPIVETTTPPVETTTPLVETTTPLVETTTPPVETTTPLVETTTPLVETTTPLPGVTTPAPGVTTPDSPSTTTPVPTTTKIPGPCDGNPCKHGSTCEPRFDKQHVCLCLGGDYNYKDNKCVTAKIFPGQLILKDVIYNDQMAVTTSKEFLENSLRITGLLDEVFKISVGKSRVLKLSKPVSTYRTVLTKGVDATVEISFNKDAEMDKAKVEGIIKKQSCDEVGCLLPNTTYVSKTLCDPNPCDPSSSTCTSGEGNFTCTCFANYIETDFSKIFCVACAVGTMRPINATECQACGFGFSGVDCEDAWQLALVVVGTLLGVTLLIAAIVLPILARKFSKSSKMEGDADLVKPYVSHPPIQQPMVNSNYAKSQAASFNRPANGLSAFANAGVPRIPRATTTNSWDSRTNLEMNLSNSRQNLIPAGRNSRFRDDYDDMNPSAQVRPQGGQYAPSRPQNNPYAQNQAQVNPYAQSQGNSNPYGQSQGNSNPYNTQDNGRRFN